MSRDDTADVPDRRTDPAEARARPGRKRDAALDDVILDAALAVLSQTGYDGMTVDLVAARAGSARATVYRRWPTKAELALATVTRLSRTDVGGGELPDTGSLREDMVAMILDLDDAQQQLRIGALTALLSLPRDDARLADAAREVGVGPWIAVNRALVQRAVDRGEFPAPADIDAIAGVIPMLCVARAVQQLPITRRFCLSLIDGVILPALRGGP